MKFSESNTRENLMKAFAGESQARNRYVFSAYKAKNENLFVIESIFEFTAKQEEAHAKVFYESLSKEKGNSIKIAGDYPVDIYEDTLSLLKMAHHNELQEYENDYRKFASIAKEEGYLDIYNIFSNIANIEKTHGDRFGQFADLYEQGKLFVSEIETQWMCLNCGYIFTGTKAPEKCPVCKHDRGFFIRLKMSPYTI